MIRPVAQEVWWHNKATTAVTRGHTADNAGTTIDTAYDSSKKRYWQKSCVYLSTRHCARSRISYHADIDIIVALHAGACTRQLLALDATLKYLPQN